MSFVQRVAPLLLVASVAGLAGCSMAPFRVAGSDAAMAKAEAESGDLLPRLQPRALGICYNPSFNEPAEVEAEAVYRCGEGGRVEKLDEDFFWNDCSLTQPHRVNYICYPPDRAKRLRGDGSTPPAN